MKSTRLSTRRWERAKAIMRRSVADWVDNWGEYPDRYARKILWVSAYDRARRELEVRVVPERLPTAAPHEPERLAEGAENLGPEPDRHV